MTSQGTRGGILFPVPKGLALQPSSQSHYTTPLYRNFAHLGRNLPDNTGEAKPDGVLGCEIWVKVGGVPPTDPSELQLRKSPMLETVPRKYRRFGFYASRIYWG
jgi:hypothetical protein